jgi:site-specific recombinase XerC
MYVRHLETRGYAAATVIRRLGTVATFYKYAVIDGVIPANPAGGLTRPLRVGLRAAAWVGKGAKPADIPLPIPVLRAGCL